LRQIFETVLMAKVSTSALDARSLGLLSESDRIVMNIDYLLAEARRTVLILAADGYIPPTITGNVYAAGRDHFANLQIEIYTLQNGGYISEYDANIATHLAHVLCGGKLSAPTWMDEQYFLDLEREAFLSLIGEAKTQERIWHMLKQGKPLRN
jgi:3-hydroxyacyl-CoA dehydrogenase